ERTASQIGSIVPAVITIYEDRSFQFITKAPPSTDFIKKALGIERGSGAPGKTIVGSLTRAQLRTIAEAKMADLNTIDVDEAMKIIAGTARSMGITVEPE
ncbi:MAG: 50S ribosomal protein L11, partial [Chthonomonadales bacterium]|nr:50S ribosomal protein L11 [Chthonomonadales bacterium]